MADLDLDAIAAIETEWDGYADDAWVTLTVPERDALVAEVRRLRAIEDAARAFVEYGNEAVVADHQRLVDAVRETHTEAEARAIAARIEEDD